MIAEIRRLTDRPVRYVANSHWHDDHVIGNEAYLEAYPGVTFVAHHHTREDGLESVPRNIRSALDAYVTRIPQIEEALRTGIKTDGSPMTEEERVDMAHRLSVYKPFLEKIRSAQFVPATLTFDRSLTLWQGDREVRLLHLGAGNTRGDVVLYLPGDRIVATGDLLVHPVPFAFGSNIAAWADTLTALRALDTAIIVPGHGPVMRDHAFMEDVAALLAEITRQVRDGVARGLSLEEVRSSLQLEAFRDRIAGDDPARLGTWEGSIVAAAVKSAYEQAPRTP